MMRKRSTALTFATTVMLAMGVIAVSCHVEKQVTYANESSSVVTLFIDGVQIDTIEPGKTQAVTHLKEKGDTDRVEVYAEDGRKLLDQTYSWEDFEAMDFRVVIRDP